MSLFAACRRALALADPDSKVAALAALPNLLAAQTDFSADPHAEEELGQLLLIPGRPEKPKLVAARDVPRRALSSISGRGAFIHAIAHIEFNAINLALDALCRYSDMPLAFYQDWLRVATDEARHFQLLRDRLETLGYAYGDFVAHNGLWDMAIKTAPNVLHRMALVPRVLEARGLDVTPAMIERLANLGDNDSVEILETILREEIPHVAIGTRWFHYCCEQQGIEPDRCFLDLLQTYEIASPGRFSGGRRLNIAARREAGFSEMELNTLAAWAKAAPAA